MRQRQDIGIAHIHLIIKNVQVTRTWAIRNRAHASQLVLNNVQIIQQLLGRNARTQQHHGVHENILVLVVRRLTLVEAGDIDDLGVGKRT